MAIRIECINGGESEELLCKIKINAGFVHQRISDIAQKMLENDMAKAFLPIKEFKISKKNETDEFEEYTINVNYIFRFVLATVHLYCGHFDIASESFEELLEEKNNTSSLKNIDQIFKSLPSRIGFCEAILAQNYYKQYCESRNIEYLQMASKALDNIYCKQINDKNLLVLKGICYFVLDRNIALAEQCMENAGNGAPVIKFNKVFLKLYSAPTSTNLMRAYNVYKDINKIGRNELEQIEGFIYNEYTQDKTKWQLLFLLLMIYDYQCNSVLAKRALLIFIADKNAQAVLMSRPFKTILDKMSDKYKDIIIDESEEYSL